MSGVTRVHISVVVPVYGGESCLQELYRRLCAALEPISPDFEIVLVEDCGPDRSWALIEELGRADARVRGLQLTRNFGQHHAITAGLRAARGDWVVVMDCDLQDRPEEIPRLYAKAQEGYECVLARRTRRRDPLLRRLGSRAFYALFNYLTDLRYDGSVANFSIVSRQVVDEVNRMNEAVRFYGGLLSWLGFARAYIEVQHDPRFAGESSYSFMKLLRLSLSVILAHSNKPLRLCVTAGVVLSTVSFAGGVWLFVRALAWGTPVMGWSSLIVSIYFATGAIILTLGILGLYVDKIFSEVKRRPLFVVRKRTFDA
jgi:dolichol-phosphate mannosyltransferase